MAKKGKITINRELCKGCLLCVRVCAAKSLEADKELNNQGVYPALIAQASKCTGCGNCFEVCPDVCICVFQFEEAAV
ncbi:4Fe-4S ferredoxin [Spirochaetia bacterium]|nr:4Fe-4S ferredoxin [Spirochaetia bacterium]